jgi:hypothetical protein
MRASAYYWLGYASLYLLMGIVQFFALEAEESPLHVIQFVADAWTIGLVGAFGFGLLLLVLRSLRPCRPENGLSGAALGALTAMAVIASGVGLRESAFPADRLLLANLISSLILHFATPRTVRHTLKSGRTPPLSPALSAVGACQIFAFSFALLSICWFIAFAAVDGSASIRFVALPVLFMMVAMYGFITGVLFGAGAALAYFARSARTLRGWHCAVCAGLTIVLLLIESSLAGRFGYYLNEVSWLMSVPLLLGLGAVMLPARRETA